MTSIAKGAIAAVSVCLIAGCGGTNSPLLGTATSPRVRALNLLGSSVSAFYTNNSNALGTIAADTVGTYSAEGEGNNTVIFDQAGSAVTSLNTVFQYGNYYTVAVYNKAGTDGTFSVVDNNIALNNGQGQIRAVNANTTATTAVDVYVQAGSTNTPTLTAGNLISASGGLAFGTATAYTQEGPGQYTVTVTPTGNNSVVLLNTTVSLTGGQSISVYALTGSTSVTTIDDEGG